MKTFAPTKTIRPFKTALCLLALSFLFSCAHTHTGPVGRSVTRNPIDGMAMSARNVQNDQDESFQMVEITIENTTDDWLRIHKTNLYVTDPAKSKISAVVGSDLKSWAEAMEYKRKRDQYNKGLAQTALIIGGAILGSSSDNTTAVVGGAMMVGSAAWILTESLQFNYNQATNTEKVPENHVFREAAIPGKSFIRRWILINRPSKTKLATIVLEVETVDNKHDYVQIKL